MKEVRSSVSSTRSTHEVRCERLCASSGLQMEMTAPVLVRLPEETKMWEPAIYMLNFLLPAAYQEKAPVPTNDKVSSRRPRPPVDPQRRR